jgi:hypothetical protein
MPRRPIGRILVENQAITEEQLAAALAEQERSGKRLGEILIEAGQMSWLAFARAMEEQVLDIPPPPAEYVAPEDEAERGTEGHPEVEEPQEEPRPDPIELLRAMAERIANLPPVPDPLPSPQLQPAPQPQATLEPHQAPPPAASDPEHKLARAVAEQVANLDSAPVEQPATTHLLRLTPTPPTEHDSQTKLLSIEAMLRERQRAFIELVSTAEALRARVAWLEDQLEERNRELARLRLRAS